MAIGGIEKPSNKASVSFKSRAMVIHTIYGGHWAMMAGVKPDTRTLQALGRCMVASFKRESARYLIRIGWSGKDPMGGPPLWDSFSFKLKGTNVQIRSSFYGMKELAHGSIKPKRMTWLTQEYKEQNPQKFKITPQERKLGKITNDNRMPLVVPIISNGTIEFRMAPLKLTNAWVHPGIAKFTFFETSIRRGLRACVKIVISKINAKK